MSFSQFDTSRIEESKQKYAEEAKKRWGDTDAYAEYESKEKSRNAVRKKAMDDKGEAILSEFGRKRSLAPDCEEVQKLVERWKEHITDKYYTCTKEILSGFGKMYVGDERFTRYIDRYGEGTAVFMSAAIAVYSG